MCMYHKLATLDSRFLKSSLKWQVSGIQSVLQCRDRVETVSLTCVVVFELHRHLHEVTLLY
jgi:hypothetical protein